MKKRTKKLLSVCTALSGESEAQTDKVFLLLFLQKKKTLAYVLRTFQNTGQPFWMPVIDLLKQVKPVQNPVGT